MTVSAGDPFDDMAPWESFWRSAPAEWSALLRMTLRVAAVHQVRALAALRAVPAFDRLLVGLAAAAGGGRGRGG